MTVLLQYSLGVAAAPIGCPVACLDLTPPYKGVTTVLCWELYNTMTVLLQHLLGVAAAPIGCPVACLDLTPHAKVLLQLSIGSCTIP